MANTSNIREHMPVVASDGKHVGTVDHFEGQQIKLTRNDPSAQGKHHYIPANWVDSVDEHVHLNKTSQEVTQQWTTDS